MSLENGLPGNMSAFLGTILGITIIVWNSNIQGAEQSSLKSGKQLVDIHCTHCHIAPKPIDLPKVNWPIALHWMGNFIGMRGNEFDDLIMGPADRERNTGDDYTFRYTLIDSTGKTHYMRIFKDRILQTPVMSKAEWLSVGDYFESHSQALAKMLTPRNKQPPLQGFSVNIPKLDIEPNGLVFTMQVDDVKGLLYVGRGVQNDWIAGGHPGFEGIDDLLAFELKTGQRVGYASLAADPTNIELTKSGLRVSTHGQMPVEIDNSMGQIIDWDNFTSKQARAHMLVNGLHRVTGHESRDLNADGLDDILVTSFGDGIFRAAGGACLFIGRHLNLKSYNSMPVLLSLRGLCKGH